MILPWLALGLILLFSTSDSNNLDQVQASLSRGECAAADSKLGKITAGLTTEQLSTRQLGLQLDLDWQLYRWTISLERCQQRISSKGLEAPLLGRYTRLYAELGMLNRWQEHLKSALVGSPQRVDLLIERTRIEHAQGDNKKALATLQLAMKHGSKSAASFFLLGLIHSSRGHMLLAKDALDSCLSLQPQHLDARIELGDVLSSLQEFKAAIEEFEKAMLLRPRHARATYGYSRALLQNNELQWGQQATRCFQLLSQQAEQLKDLRVQIRVNEGDPRPLATLASFWFEHRQGKRALALVDRLGEHATPELLVAAADTHAAAGNNRRALQLAKQVLQKETGLLETTKDHARIVIAELLIRHGQAIQGLSALKRCQPESFPMRKALTQAEALARLGRPFASILPFVEQAIHFAPQKLEPAITWLDLVNSLHPDSLGEFERFRTQYPKSAAFDTALATAAFEAKKPERSMEFIGRALRRNPSYPEALRLHAKLKDPSSPTARRWRIQAQLLEILQQKP